MLTGVKLMESVTLRGLSSAGIMYGYIGEVSKIIFSIK